MKEQYSCLPGAPLDPTPKDKSVDPSKNFGAKDDKDSGRREQEEPEWFMHVGSVLLVTEPQSSYKALRCIEPDLLIYKMVQWPTAKVGEVTMEEHGCRCSF